MDVDPGSSKRVLVADESTSSRELLRVILEAMGVQVQVVPSRSAVLDAVRTFQPHLVLLDVSQLDTETRALVSALCHPVQGETVALVAMAATELYPEPHTMRAAGFAEVVTKPITPRELREAMHRQLAF